MDSQSNKSSWFTLIFSFFNALFVTLIVGLLGVAYWDVKWWQPVVLSLVMGGFSYVFLIRTFRRKINKVVREVYEHIVVLEKKTPSKSLQEIRDIDADTGRFIKAKRQEVETLKTRDAFRREFIGNLSHELKTPLFTLQGYIETLIDGVALDKDIRLKYLKRASKGGERLAHIIGDLDLITKLELGEFKPNFVVFDIVELFKNVFDLLEMKAADRRITLSFDREYQSIKVVADRERIYQVVDNLLVNSIKYGKSQGTTEVSFEDLSKGKVMVKIGDNGDGIESKYMNRIFERFFRTEQSRSRDEGGSGLGLSIVKHIIESHEEKITVKSVFGVGSEFSFTLQKANASQLIDKQNLLLG